MHVADGECVVIVGSSESGKSTVAQRLYGSDSGGIFIGQSELRSTQVDRLREHVAVVSQHPNLFDASISENIVYRSKGLSEQDIRRAGKADEFTEGLPEGRSGRMRR
jgi:ATP-binding cassette, subfamily B (MDR/TAP), member 1